MDLNFPFLPYVNLAPIKNAPGVFECINGAGIDTNDLHSMLYSRNDNSEDCV